MDLSPQTRLHDLLKEHPGLLDFLVGYHPRFSKLKNPFLRKTVARVATLKDIADMGEIPTEKLIADLEKAIGEGLTKKDDDRKERLKSIIIALHQGADPEELKARFAALLEDVGPGEIAGLEQELIKEGLSPEDIKSLCDVHVALFQESLEAQEDGALPEDHPIREFQEENLAISRLADALEREPGPGALEELERAVLEHYIRKENSLFPLLEARGVDGPPKVMWGVHDDIRALFQEAGQREEALPRLLKAVRDMVYKEEKVLFPMALEVLGDEDWKRLREGDVPAPAYPASGTLTLGTGSLTPEQVDLLLRHLPLDITFVDENDTVRYYSDTPERVFPRMPEIIGRRVQNCHPPKSVHMVNRILQEFKAGRRDVAEFWIRLRGRLVHIRYFAVRDEKGAYRGVLEVTQDITDIKNLEGERRLLDWE